MWLRSFLGSPPENPPARKWQRRRTRSAAGKLRLEPLDGRIVPSFVGPTDYPVGQTPVSIVAFDFNGDGKLDLATGNSSDDTVSVLVGNGNGTFQAALISAPGAGTGSLLAGDLNGDAKADLVTTSSGSNLNVLLGTGTGTFQPPQAVTPPGQFPPGYTDPSPLPQYILSSAVGDLNGDGKLDLVVGGQTFFSVFLGSGPYGNYYDYHSDGYVNVLMGNGDGTFAAGQTTHVGSYNNPSSVVLADFSGDGKLDVATDDSTGCSVRVLPGNGDGTLGGPVGSPQTGYGVDLFSGVGAADFDGDGKPDLLARDYGYGLTVLKGVGNGTFTQGQSTNAGAYPHSAVVGDVNADGTLDIAVTWSSTVYGSYGYWGNYDPVTTGHVNVLLGYGDGSFALPQTSDLGSHAGFGSLGSSVLRDFTADGYPDFAAADYYQGVVVARNAADWVVPGALTIGDATVTEGNSGTVAMTFSVTLKHGGSQPVTVNWATSSYTALAPSDYQAASGPLIFLPGETTKLITVQVNGDLVDEPNQQFFVNLSGATNADILDGQGVGTIVDDDPAPTLSINDASILEGDKGYKTMKFDITLTGATENWVSVNFSTANGTATLADQDYLAGSGAVYFSPGTTTAQVSVQIKGDKVKELDETLFVNLGGASNAVIVDGIGLGTIRDDDNKGKK